MRLKKIIILIKCVLILEFTGCSTVIILEHDQKSISSRHFAQDKNLEEDVKSIVDPVIKSKYAHGVIIGIYLPDGSKQFYGFGSAGANINDPPPNQKTLFALGSLSKGYIAALVSVLLHDGTLSVDDTLGKLLPQENFSPSVKNITVLQLMRHLSGLPKQPNDINMLKSLARYTWNGKNLYEHLDQKYIFNFLSQFEVPAHPALTYSNIGYGLLGHIIEQKTHRSIEVLIDEKILKPLNLHATGYHVEKLPGFDHKAIGHAGDQPAFITRGTPLADWDFGPFFTSSAGIYSTPEDLLNFGIAHLEPEKSELHQRLAENINLEKLVPITHYPFPEVQWVTDQVENEKITYQLGLTSGYSSYIGIDKEKKIVVIALQNSFNWTEKMGHRLLHRLSKYYDEKN